MKRLLGSVLLAGFLLLCPLCMQATPGPQGRAVKRGKVACPSRGRYYILTKATLISDETVLVFGASNLPPGAVLIVYITDYTGEGGRTLNNEVRVTVGKDGLFTAAIHPQEGLMFRAHMVCDVSFEPNYPPQPKSVLKVVGIRGRRLGTHDKNPEVGDYPSQTTLGDTTVVMP